MVRDGGHIGDSGRLDYQASSAAADAGGRGGGLPVLMEPGRVRVGVSIDVATVTRRHLSMLEKIIDMMLLARS